MTIVRLITIKYVYDWTILIDVKKILSLSKLSPSVNSRMISMIEINSDKNKTSNYKMTILQLLIKTRVEL